MYLLSYIIYYIIGWKIYIYIGVYWKKKFPIVRVNKIHFFYIKHKCYTLKGFLLSIIGAWNDESNIYNTDMSKTYQKTVEILNDTKQMRGEDGI